MGHGFHSKLLNNQRVFDTTISFLVLPHFSETQGKKGRE